MTDRFNTIAGWVLAAGIVMLGASVVTGEVFHAERPHTMGYPIEGVEVEGPAVDDGPPLAVLLAQADVAAGEQAFRKCMACHNIDQGGPNQLGPNLWAIMGDAIGHGRGGYAFSDALRTHGGSWGWEEMDAWLANPRRFAPGNKMTFAGIANPQERANIMAFMNTRGSSLPLPAVPAEAEAPAAEEAPDVDVTGAGGGPAEDQPAPNGQQPNGNQGN